MTFCFFCINPTGKVKNDCAIRAIAYAEQKSWLDVYDALTTIGRLTYDSPTAPATTSLYLSKYETIPVMYNTTKGKKRLTVMDVCKLKGTYVIKVAGHLTVVSNGVCYDVWDCTKKSSYKIWRVKA